MRTTRERLLDAATEAFATKGFHATTTRDIAKAAGVTSGAVYIHFESKEDLLFHVSAVGHGGSAEMVAKSAQGPGGPGERLGATVYALALWHAEHRTRARVVNYDLVALSEDHQREIMKLRRSIFESVRNLIEEGVSCGDFTVDDPSQSTMQILSLCVDISRWFQPGKAWTPEGVAGMTRDSALKIVSYSGR